MVRRELEVIVGLRKSGASLLGRIAEGDALLLQVAQSCPPDFQRELAAGQSSSQGLEIVEGGSSSGFLEVVFLIGPVKVLRSCLKGVAPGDSQLAGVFARA
jgi:hypothetical protein